VVDIVLNIKQHVISTGIDFVLKRNINQRFPIKWTNEFLILSYFIIYVLVIDDVYQYEGCLLKLDVSVLLHVVAILTFAHCNFETCSIWTVLYYPCITSCILGYVSVHKVCSLL